MFPDERQCRVFGLSKLSGRVAGQSVGNTAFIDSRTTSRKQPELRPYLTLPVKQLQHTCKHIHTHTVVAIQKHNIIFTSKK